MARAFAEWGFRVVVGALAFCAACAPAARAAPPVYDVEIVRSHPHDPGAFTQGLFYLDGYLYESTGLKGQSSLRKVDIESGAVLQKTDLAADIFGEGIALWSGKVIGLTWRSQIGFVYDLETLKQEKRFSYPGEGWGITADNKRLIMSDGTDELRFIDPRSLREKGRVSVTLNSKPLRDLNELEWIDGEVYANVWRTDLIVRIDPKTGAVAGVIDARPLRAAIAGAPNVDVLNGIAYDTKTGRLFVTGKYWPKLFEIRLVPRNTQAN
jgi:glutaminyl-peptide cyclotransferase